MIVPRMHPDEVTIHDGLVRRLLRDQRPELAELPLRRIDAWGTDHVIFRLGEELAVRLPKVAWAADQGQRERRWLPALAPHLPVELPAPEHVGLPGHGYPFRWYIAPWIDAEPVDARTADLRMLAVDLARFVLALEAVDSADAPAAIAGQRGGSLAAADEATRVSAERLRGATDVDGLLIAWRMGVDASPWSEPSRWVHGDLMDGNLLLRSGRLHSVIDWGGLKAGDPAVDLMIAWSLFDADSRDVYRDELGFVDEAMWLRGRAWAVSAAVMAIPYYRETNPDILARSWRCVAAVLLDLGR